MKNPEHLPLEFKRSGPHQTDGNYMIPHPRIKEYRFHIVFSSGLGWEHLSVSLVKVQASGQPRKNTLLGVTRCCTWEEMCFLKDMFWDVNECVVQYHPPMSQYVSNHQYCLHLWRPTEATMPAPDTILVGLSNIDKEMMDKLQELFPGRSMVQYYTAIYYTDPKLFKDDFKEWEHQMNHHLLSL